MDKSGVRVMDRFLRRSLWGVRLVEVKSALFETSSWCARLLLCRLLRQRPWTKWPRWRGVGGEGGGGHGSWGGHECTRWGAEWDEWGGGDRWGKGVFFIYFLAFIFRLYVFSLGLHTCTRTRGRLEGVWERCNKELKVWSGEGGCVRAPLGGGSRVQLVYLCIS